MDAQLAVPPDQELSFRKAVIARGYVVLGLHDLNRNATSVEATGQMVTGLRSNCPHRHN
jgi:hypothetical protein